ncbi:MAG: carboxymuconolactone decarboxylase family protein [Dermatophilaceae bacterium]
MTHGKQVLDDLRPHTAALRGLIPEVYEGYSHTHKAALAAGALDVKTKELIALGIAVTSQCDGCIASHARGVAAAGATKEEVAEAVGVTILMNGGPGTVYGPRAFAAYTEFAEQLAARGRPATDA